MKQSPELAEAWVARYLAIKQYGDKHPLAERYFDSYLEASRLCLDNPQEALNFIDEVIALSDDEFVGENLAAGPLEDLLAKHGEVMWPQIESRALIDPRMRWLLAGVWRNAIPDGVWNRMSEVADDRATYRFPVRVTRNDL
jgi:hypothetical protein